MKQVLYILIGVLCLIALGLDIAELAYYKIAVACTTLTILLTVLFNSKKDDALSKKYVNFILAGLLCCAAADFIPYVVNDFFVWELSFYIIAKFLFAEAFRAQGTLKVNHKLLGILGVAGLSLFVYLTPYFGEYFVPIALYFGIMIYMSWAGVGLHMAVKSTQTKLIFYAVFVWFGCEMISAVERFIAVPMLTGLFVHISYWVALLLIAFSAMKKEENKSSINPTLKSKKKRLSFS